MVIRRSRSALKCVLARIWLTHRGVGRSLHLPGALAPARVDQALQSEHHHPVWRTCGICGYARDLDWELLVVCLSKVAQSTPRRSKYVTHCVHIPGICPEQHSTRAKQDRTARPRRAQQAQPEKHYAAPQRYTRAGRRASGTTPGNSSKRTGHCVCLPVACSAMIGLSAHLQCAQARYCHTVAYFACPSEHGVANS